MVVGGQHHVQAVAERESKDGAPDPRLGIESDLLRSQALKLTSGVAIHADAGDIVQSPAAVRVEQGRASKAAAGVVPCRNRPGTPPIPGPLVEGGPALLVDRYDLDHEPGYVDACHLCYSARLALRSRFPAELAPDQMYGVTGD